MNTTVSFDVIDNLAASFVAASPSDLSTISTVLDHVDDCARILANEVGTAPTIHAIRDNLEAAILNEGDESLRSLDMAGKNFADLQAILDGSEVAGDARSQAHLASSAQVSAAPQAVQVADPAMLAEFVTEATERLDSAENIILSFESSASPGDLIGALFRDFHTIKGGTGMVHLKNAGLVAHHAEGLMAKARDRKLSITRARADLLIKAVDLLRQQVSECAAALAENRSAKELQNHADLIHQLEESSHQDIAAVPALDSPAAAIAIEDTPAKGSAAHDLTIKVSTERLDTLINLVGELIISESVITRGIHSALGRDNEISRDLRRLQSIARSLQDASMSLRMVPMKALFGRMMRLVRDLNRKTRKDVELVLIGSETEIDRNLVEAITEPLMHMIRNSMDHGIETPADRRAKGKNPCGKIVLSAEHAAGNVIVRISDDGRGLPTQRIRDRAVQVGLLPASEVRSDSDIWKLIFHPGLSTAETVSDLSGRGVGMDVVKRNIEAVRGRIEINSIADRGTDFIVRLPLTLAVIEGLVVTLGEERYVIPLLSVQEAIRFTDGKLAKVCGKSEVIRFRNRILPLCRLADVFSTPNTGKPEAGHLVIVKDGEREAAILVDQLVGQQQIVVKSLGKLTGDVDGISGAAILGDGCVRLILDIPGMIDHTTNGRSESENQHQ